MRLKIAVSGPLASGGGSKDSALDSSLPSCTRQDAGPHQVCRALYAVLLISGALGTDSANVPRVHVHVLIVPAFGRVQRPRRGVDRIWNVTGRNAPLGN